MQSAPRKSEPNSISFYHKRRWQIDTPVMLSSNINEKWRNLQLKTHTHRETHHRKCVSFQRVKNMYMQTHFTHRNENLLRWWIDKTGWRNVSAQRGSTMQQITFYRRRLCIIDDHIVYLKVWWTCAGHGLENARDGWDMLFKYYLEPQLDIIRSCSCKAICMLPGTEITGIAINHFKFSLFRRKSHTAYRLSQIIIVMTEKWSTRNPPSPNCRT